MANATRMPVQPAVLGWARKTAGLDVDTAASRIGVRPDRIREWEQPGEKYPTINQLRKLADAYHRPLAAMFLPAPPEEEVIESLPDFRRPSIQHQADPRPLDNAINRAYQQRDALREIAEDLDYPDDETVPPFKFELNGSSESTGEELRRWVGLDQLSTTTLTRPEVVLRTLIRNVETLNVNVIQVQRVPNHVMRGFSLGNGPCPVLALNGGDWPRGKTYTLLHEMAHIGFRTSGLCDLSQEDDNRIERKCDEISAAALMPESRIRATHRLVDEPINSEYVRDLGNAFGASAEAATIRLVGLGLASWDDYWRLKPEFEKAYEQYKTDEREKSAEEDAPIFYQLKARDLGRRFINEVLTAYGENTMSSRDLVHYLGVRYDRIPKLSAAIGQNFG